MARPAPQDTKASGAAAKPTAKAVAQAALRERLKLLLDQDIEALILAVRGREHEPLNTLTFQGQMLPLKASDAIEASARLLSQGRLPFLADEAVQEAQAGGALTEIHAMSTAISTAIAYQVMRGHMAEPITLGGALTEIREGRETLLADSLRLLEGLIQMMVEPELHRATLARKEVFERWVWPEGSRPGSLFHRLERRLNRGRALENTRSWPEDLHPASFLQWQLGRLLEASRKFYPGPKGPAGPLGGGGLEAYHSIKALLQTVLQDEVSQLIPHSWHYMAIHEGWRAVNHDRRRPMTALPAKKGPVEFVEGLGDAAWRVSSKLRGIDHPIIFGKVELFARTAGRRIQVAVPLSEDGLPLGTADALEQICGPEGLRHWVAMLTMLTSDGMDGRLRWSLDRHLEVVGYSPESRRNPELRQRVATIVEDFTRLELVVYDNDGKERDRGPLFHVDRSREPIAEEDGGLEGLFLRINPGLYDGVYQGEPGSGRRGQYWWPAPADLAKIDHVRFPAAYSLGLKLSHRLRWTLGNEREALKIGTEGLIRAMGCVEAPPSADTEARKEILFRLERTLEELLRIGIMGRIEWVDGAPGAWGSMARIYPTPGQLDRVVHGVRPLTWQGEKPRPGQSPPLTGDELREWRRKARLTQAQAAERFGVERKAVVRAEAKGAGELRGKLRTAFSGLRAQESPALPRLFAPGPEIGELQAPPLDLPPDTDLAEGKAAPVQEPDSSAMEMMEILDLDTDDEPRVPTVEELSPWQLPLFAPHPQGRIPRELPVEAYMGRHLKAWREGQWLSTEEAAQRLNISPRTLEQAEEHADAPLRRGVARNLKGLVWGKSEGTQGAPGSEEKEKA